MPSDDMTYPQAPVMTADHVEAMRLIDGHYPFADTLFPRHLIGEICQHLEALLAAPVPHTLTPLERITHASNYTPHTILNGSDTDGSSHVYHPGFTDWLKEYSHLNDDECQSDQ